METNKTKSRRRGNVHSRFYGRKIHLIQRNIGLIAIVGLFAFSVAYVYADHSVPFDSWIDHRCYTNSVGTFLCSWTPSGNTTFTPPLTEEETVEETEVIEETVEEIPVDPYEGMTREEKDIQRTIDRIEQDLIEDRESVPNADKQLLILLKRAQSECYFGVDQGQPIQAYALFGIPDGFLYIDETDFSKHSQLGKIAKLIEACKGWDKYRVTHLGEQYSDIAQATADATIWEPSATLTGNVTNTDEFMNRAISEHDILEEAEEAQDYKCSTLGKQRGFCPEGIGESVYVHDTTNNPALSKYLQYKADPENQVGEPKYSVKTNAKCYTLESFAKQYELDEEARKALLEAGGCRV